VFVILRTTCEEVDVRDLLTSLEVILAAHATDTAPQGTGHAASVLGKQELATRSSPAVEATHIIRKGEQTFVIWKLALHLLRPRERLQKPAIYLTGNLTLNNEAADVPKSPQAEYLKPYEPLPENVLAPLNFAPEFRDKNIHLAANRITKVAPSAGRKQDGIKPVRGASRRAFPALPALFTRISYSTLPHGLIASLHIETAEAVAGTFSVEEVTVTIPDSNPFDLPEGVKADVDEAAVQELSPQSWPKNHQPGDEVVLLYKLNERQATAERPVPLSGLVTLNIEILATVTLDRGSKIGIETRWETQADISQKAPLDTHYWSRPVGTPLPKLTRDSKQSSVRPASKEGATETSPPSDSGITFFISAPPTVHQHENFLMKVQCINKSHRPRRFGLSVISPEPLLSRQYLDRRTHNKDLVTDMFSPPPPRPQKTRSIEVIGRGSTTLGPVETGASDEASVALRALTTGVLDLSVLRVTDLDDHQTVDVRELPDVVALDRERTVLAGSSSGT